MSALMVKVRSCCEKGSATLLHSYASFIANKPRITLLLSMLFMIVMSGITFIVRPESLPDFSDPGKGVESRGTYISGTELAYYDQLREDSRFTKSAETPTGLWLRRRLKLESTCMRRIDYSDYFEMVFETSSAGGLLNLESMQALCRFEQEIYRRFGSESPCPYRALHNHILLYHNEIPLCASLTEDHVQNYTAALLQCYPFYRSGKLKECRGGCPELGVPEVPETCTRGRFIYDSLHSLIDSGFSPSNPRVRFTKLILQYEVSSDNLRKFHYDLLLDRVGQHSNGAVLRGYGEWGLRVKYSLVQYQINRDISLAVLSVVLVFAVMALHTKSLFMTFFSILQIILAISVAFGLYSVVLWLPYFPYLNIIAGEELTDSYESQPRLRLSVICLSINNSFRLVFLVLGVGVDDVFVLYDAWIQSAVQTGTMDSTTRLEYCFSSVGVSLFTTTLTTSSAFFSIAFSIPITALRLFGIFCGLVIVVDFLLMISYFPALILVYEKYFKSGKYCCKRYNDCTNRRRIETELGRTEVFIRDYLGAAVFRFRFPIILLCLGVAGGVGSQLANLRSSSIDGFIFFVEDNPLEVYDASLKQRFNVYTAQVQSADKMPVYMVFGVDPTENGNLLNPEDKGKLRFKPMKPFLAQEWLADFCPEFRKQGFYVKPQTFEDHMCLLEFLRGWVSFPCSSTSDLAQSPYNNYSDYYRVPYRSQCCDMRFPLVNESDFEFCLRGAAELARYNFGRTGLYFNRDELVAFDFAMQLNQSFTREFEPMDTLFKGLDTFRKNYIKSAPPGSGMDKFFFVSWFGYYDNQLGFAQGALQSFISAMIISTAVVVLVTRNIVISLIAITTLVSIVSVIYGACMLLLWELNLYESIIFCAAVGLSVDFTLHYAHAYLHAEETSRKGKVMKMYETMSVPVLYGAISTFSCGFALAFAQSLFMYKFGVFLMLTMSMSLLYSSLLLPALLYVFGPLSTTPEQTKGEKKQIIS